MGYYPTSVKVYIDFAHGPFDLTETWTEVTQYVTGRCRYEWGRSNVADDFPPGKGSYTLVNDDGRFDPSNTSGPYYGTLKPRRRTKITVTTPAGTYTVAYGVIEGWPQRWEGRKCCYVDVSFVDLTALFNQVTMPESVWDWKVEQLAPYLWYKLGSTETPYASDSSASGLRGEWRVFEGAGSPLSGVLMPKATLDAGQTGSVIPSTDRQSISWAALQAQVGQPLGGIAGAPRTPVFVPAWETQDLPNQNFAVALWVLYRQAFPVDIRNIYSSTTPIEQPLVTWGQNGAHAWRLIIRTNGKLAVEFNVGLVTLGVWDIGNSLDDGRSHLIGLARTGNEMRVTVDGSLKVQIPLTSPGTVVTPGPVTPAVIGSATVAPFSLSGLQSTIGDVIFWDRYVAVLEFAELYYAGYYGSTSTSVTTLDTDSAFTQGFTLAGISTGTNLLFGNGQTVTETISGQSFREYLSKLAATEQGLLFQDPTGDITFHGRRWMTGFQSLVVQFTLGDGAGATLGYSGLDYRDPADELQNDVTVSHPAGEERSVNAASVADYGTIRGSIDTFLASADEAKQVANFRSWRYGTPPAQGIIPDRLVVQPNTQAEFDMAASLEVADRLRITRTRPDGTALTDDYWVQGAAHEFQAESGGEWTTTVGLMLADDPAAPFIIDGSALNSTDVLWI